MRAATLLGALVLAGCASKYDEMPLPEGVTTETDSRGNEIVDTMSFTAPGADFSTVQRCIATEMPREHAVLSDASNSYTSAYTGNYYSVTKSQSVDLPAGILHADREANFVVGSGAISVNMDWIIKVYVRFRVIATPGSEATELKFTHIESAQQNTGAMQNLGFGQMYPRHIHKIGVYAELESIVNDVSSCLEGAS